MTDDDEINMYAYIDKKAHILVPFQPMDAGLRESYRRQAVDIISNINGKPYVCLNPAYTIPVVENRNLEAHRELLRKIVYGMMLQFGAMAINPNKDPGNEGNIGVISVINPTEDENIQLMLWGIPVEGKPDTFEIHGVTSLSKKG